ncbi:hypothetical protein [Chromobacterium sp. IIBBL 290-4]|uniref:hypothetical protein n=1 Tax=Chromobacterium sp. IIBBL 290-4 TaxID=2953890 RepID=UPI0020B664ED|nr:hypothetical protein [Chromobacterium sp. IIBBL 290-4]UTH73113.1 hypothetical protein NKT35_16440 [Chromobacterium sp. IIBBL 290-4]
MTSQQLLDALLRDHDDNPAEAALQLPALVLADDLPPEALPRLAWLINHLVGESLGDWSQAWRLQQGLRQDAPHAATLRHGMVAATLAGDSMSAWQLREQWLAQGIAPHELDVLLELSIVLALHRQEPPARQIQALARLLPDLQALEAGGQDAALAGCCNNIVSALLDKPELEIGDAFCKQVLSAMAHAARQLWGRAGGWLQHERAEYLLALTANRFEDWEAGLAAARAGLALIAANGEEDVDRAFLLVEAARALRGLEREGEADETLRQAMALAESFDASLRAWFDGCARRAEPVAA